LFPTSTTTRSSSAICRRSCSHDVAFSKVFRRVISKTSSAPELPLKYDLVMDLYCSCPAVSQSCNFKCFCSGSLGACCWPVLPLLFPLGASCAGVVGGGWLPAGLLILYSRLAGGPTGTMRDPNSTPMVTSWCDTKRPSHRRMVSYRGSARVCWGN
jgi:hypothetical protein